MNIEYVREVLAKEYGIHTSEELDRAIKNAKGLNISVMTAIPRNNQKSKSQKKGKRENALTINANC